MQELRISQPHSRHLNLCCDLPSLTFVATPQCIDCHTWCSVGCTGPTSSDCLACAQVKHQGSCVASCPALTFTNTSTRTCDSCRPQCVGGCTRGSSAAHRFGCVAFNMSGVCVGTCPQHVHPGCKLHCVLLRVSEWLLGPNAIPVQQLALSQQHPPGWIVRRVLCGNLLDRACTSRLLPQSCQRTKTVSHLSSIMWHRRLL